MLQYTKWKTSRTGREGTYETDNSVFCLQDSVSGWRNVFFLSAAVNMFGLVFYLTFGQAEIQDWAKERTITRLWEYRVTNLNVVLAINFSTFFTYRHSFFIFFIIDSTVLNSGCMLDFPGESLNYSDEWALPQRFWMSWSRGEPRYH